MNQEDYNKAKEEVLQFIMEGREFPLDDFPVIIDELTIHKKWGWILFYNGSKFIATKNDSYSYIGNRPLIYNWDKREVIKLGLPTKSIFELIKDYEERRL